MRHHHGCVRVGEKTAFDDEALRRPPHPTPPPPAAPGDPAAGRLVERYREVAAEFRVSVLPPLQTAHWLLRPPGAIRGTRARPEDAGEWLCRQLDGAAHRFAAEQDRDADRLGCLVAAAAAWVAWGGDVSLGHYLTGTLFHSVALVGCSPNRSQPELPCPQA